jgi:uncharacterized protein (TIGR01777 family)
VSPRRIVVVGGSGFIGSRLVCALCDRGDEVIVLTRDPGRAVLPASARSLAWTPDRVGPWSAVIAGSQAVVTLSGAELVGARWTPARKAELEASRVGATETIVRAIEATAPPERPTVLVGASAIGWYGPRSPDDEITEEAPPGGDWLAGLVGRWEVAEARASALGVRVVHARFGIVLGKGGGALERLVMPFRMHAGGFVGTGAQIVSWVHAADACGLLLLSLDDDRVRGPINVTAPSPVAMAQLAETIGRTLGRRSYLHVPAAVVRAALGEGAGAILTGQRVLPHVALGLGYRFRFPDLAAALADLLE